MLRFVAKTAPRHPKAVITGWVIIVIAGLVVGAGVFDRLSPAVRAVDGSESARGLAFLRQSAPQEESIAAVISGLPATDAGLQQQISAARQEIAAMPGVAQVPDPYRTPGLVADDNAAVLLPVTFETGLPNSTMSDAVRKAASRLRDISAPTVEVSGNRLLSRELSEQARRDVQRAEVLSIPIIMVLLIIIFAGVLAASLPVTVAIVAAASTLLILYLFSLVTDVSVYAVQVPTMLGLGLAVDYGLLMVTRFREERASTASVSEAVSRAVTRSGRTIVFSGLTVAASLSGVLVFPSPLLRSLSLAAMAVVLLAMLAAVTLVPAMLALFGHRIRPGRPVEQQGRMFASVARGALRRPVLITVLVVAGLLVLAAPVLGVKLTGGDARSLPRSSEARQFYEQVTAHFPPGITSNPVIVVAHAGSDPALGTQLRGLEGVVTMTQRAYPDGSTVYRLTPAGPSDGERATDLAHAVRDLRDGQPVLVTGDAASLVDFEEMLRGRLLWALAVVVISIFALLFAFTGSLWIPLRTFGSTLLSLAAALGVVVWVFQEGHLDGLFTVSGAGALNVVVPPAIVSLAFGLAMDYEIFILARMRDVWEASGDHRAAIVTGLQRTGRVVTSAALLIVVVFACFMTGGFDTIQQIGLGLSLAVLIDATIVRMLLVPATMALLGRHAWWAPRALRRLHDRLGLREEPAASEPAANMVVPQHR
ncbi:MMPL family transporter [Micromonospora sp. CPCC 205371]|nr:MMPL family transporter [Micromonospora sp. CPCC 205371]